MKKCVCIRNFRNMKGDLTFEVGETYDVSTNNLRTYTRNIVKSKNGNGYGFLNDTFSSFFNKQFKFGR